MCTEFPRGIFRCETPELRRPPALHLPLGVNTFPITSIIWISVECLPRTPLGAVGNLPQVVRCQPLNPFAGGILTSLAVVNEPITSQHSFARLELHHGPDPTTVIVDPGGTGPFGITNSGAPHAVCLPPINPGFLWKTGDAKPSAGVVNSITVNVLDGGIVRVSDRRYRWRHS